MLIRLKLLFLSFFLMAASLSAVDKQYTKELDEMGKLIRRNFWKFNNTRDCVSTLAQPDNNNGFVSSHALAWMFLGTAIFHDVMSATLGGPATAILEGAELVTRMRAKFNYIRANFDQDKTIVMVNDGFEKRFEQIKPYIQSNAFSYRDAQILMLAGTSYDSYKESFSDRGPSYLTLGTGKKLSFDVFKEREFPDTFQEAFKKVSGAAYTIYRNKSNWKNQDSFYQECIKYLGKDASYAKYPYSSIIEDLGKAADYISEIKEAPKEN